MNLSTRTLAVFWISAVLLSGCMNRAPSLRMLDERAGYDQGPAGDIPALREAGIGGFQGGPIPVRTRAKIAACYFSPHEMVSHDYFWGAWVSVVYEQDQWTLEEPQMPPPASAFTSVTHRASRRPKVRKPGARPVFLK